MTNHGKENNFLWQIGKLFPRIFLCGILPFRVTFAMGGLWV
jgi:hypothetical protein